jgi:hypothetical protein
MPNVVICVAKRKINVVIEMSEIFIVYAYNPSTRGY